MARLILRGLFGLVCLLGLAQLSACPAGKQTDRGILRLSWRLTGARIERMLTPEELEKLPPHMRPRDGVAETTELPYRLSIAIDTRRDSFRVTPAGWRGDRPLFVLRDYPLAPGHHQVVVEFGPEDTEVEATRYSFAQSIESRAGQILTVRLSPEQDQLILTAAPEPERSKRSADR